jgi:hypothetical protein
MGWQLVSNLEIQRGGHDSTTTVTTAKACQATMANQDKQPLLPGWNLLAGGLHV